MNPRKKPYPVYTCKTCGVIFISKNNPGKLRTYCSNTCSKRGANNAMWMGNKVGYKALHAYIKRNLPKPDKCVFCEKETTFLDLANVSGNYKRDFSDWEWLCRSCHMKKDGRMLNLKRGTVKPLLTRYE